MLPLLLPTGELWDCDMTSDSAVPLSVPGQEMIEIIIKYCKNDLPTKT